MRGGGSWLEDAVSRFDVPPVVEKYRRAILFPSSFPSFTFFQSVFIFIKDRFHKEGICFISRDAEEKVDWVDNKKKGGENCGAILKRGNPPPSRPSLLAATLGTNNRSVSGTSVALRQSRIYVGPCGGNKEIKKTLSVSGKAPGEAKPRRDYEP